MAGAVTPPRVTLEPASTQVKVVTGASAVPLERTS